MSFGRDVERIARNMNVSANTVARATIIELFASVIADTPVDTGRLRGNWQTTTNEQATGSIERFGAEVSLQDVLASVDKPDLYFLTNNLPYAERIEFDGWSGQAPEGMVRKNARRIRAIVAAKARSV